jgi:hypothetical protein
MLCNKTWNKTTNNKNQNFSETVLVWSSCFVFWFYLSFFDLRISSLKRVQTWQYQVSNCIQGRNLGSRSMIDLDPRFSKNYRYPKKTNPSLAFVCMYSFWGPTRGSFTSSCKAERQRERECWENEGNIWNHLKIGWKVNDGTCPGNPKNGGKTNCFR